MSQFRRQAGLVLCAALCLSVAGASADQQPARDLVFDKSQRKLALVIGNDSYPRAQLLNARNDARSVAKALQELGFVVTTVEDATREQLVSAVDKFGDALRPTDVAWFFYAGHGLQVGGENYLIPVDFTGNSQTTVRLSALPVTELQTAFSKAQVSVVVLDACRNNPVLAARGSGSGLAPIEARGSLVAFSTGAGQIASDDDGSGNGLFTNELLRVLKQPGLSVRDMFFRVRQRVFEASSGQQFPAVYDGLLGNFVLRPQTDGVPNTTAADSVEKPVTTPKPTATGNAKRGGSGKWLLVGGGAAAAAAGVVVAGGSGSGSGSGNTGTTVNTPTGTSLIDITTPGRYTGTYSRQYESMHINCVQALTLNGTLIVTLQQQSDGSVTGTASTTTAATLNASTCVTVSGTNVEVIGGITTKGWNLPVTGTASKLQFTGQQQSTSPDNLGRTIINSYAITFDGALVGSTVSGTLKYETSGRQADNNELRSSATVTVTVTLR
jgi:hypothetical protein